LTVYHSCRHHLWNRSGKAAERLGMLNAEPDNQALTELYEIARTSA
jgi:hypothetical protein